MRILAFSDLHCHNYSSHSKRLPNGLNSRFVDCLNILEQAEKVVKEKGVQIIVFAGDLFESRTMLPVEVYSETIRAVRKLAGCVAKDRFFLLVGNHDRWTRVGNIIAVEAFRDICRVIDTPQVVEVDKSWLGFMPHFDTPSDFRTALDKLTTTTGGSDVLFMHQTFREAVAGPTDRKINSLLSLEEIPSGKFGFLVAGDIHKRQFMKQFNFHYLGSPLQLDFGERGEDKAFSLIDLETKSVETVLTDAPRFYFYDAGNNSPSTVLPGDADHSRDFVRVRYKERHAERIPRLQAKYPNVEFEKVREDTKRKDLKDREDVLLMSDRDLLYRFSTSQASGSTLIPDFDPEECVEIGMEELGEVTR